ncbi:hypothetical protein CPB84DRAFT_1742072 [Gymnopilus junonius]|uniref:Uncharacterized protein n=1 Tax=Gymnopilus junonius TaxID=109634 RepID=A0A9P5TW33_GYMJU|nr:hypothetical protein CPB84DRAFT_1742072 [Gymnopilus junonius]
MLDTSQRCNPCTSNDDDTLCQLPLLPVTPHSRPEEHGGLIPAPCHHESTLAMALVEDPQGLRTSNHCHPVLSPEPSQDARARRLRLTSQLSSSHLLRIQQPSSSSSVNPSLGRYGMLETMQELGILGIQDMRVGRSTSHVNSSITSPSILFLDEPTSGLDAYNVYNIIDGVPKDDGDYAGMLNDPDDVSLNNGRAHFVPAATYMAYLEHARKEVFVQDSVFIQHYNGFIALLFSPISLVSDVRKL